MNRPPNLPTEVQETLLHAILDGGDQGIEAWRRWQQQVRLDDIDPGSYRILPMLHHALSTRDVTDPDLDRYRGVARKVWYRNNLIFHQLSKLLADYPQPTGQRVAVLKGSALAHLYYPNPALRAMDDADIMIPRDETAFAIDWFLDRDWVSKPLHPRKSLKAYVRHKQHSIDLKSPAGQSIDLHWQLFNLPAPTEYLDAIWQAMQPLKIGATATQTLCTTDHFLHTCTHGIFWNSMPALRWVIDADCILRNHADQIDWDRWLYLVEGMQIAHFVRPAIDYLRGEFALPIPEKVGAALAKIPLTDWQKSELQVLTRPNPHIWRDYIAGPRYHRLRAVIPEWRAKPAWRARCDYHKLLRGLDTDGQLAGLAVRRIGNVIRNGLSR